VVKNVDYLRKEIDKIIDKLEGDGNDWLQSKVYFRWTRESQYY
jgi:hypothetical protein